MAALDFSVNFETVSTSSTAKTVVGVKTAANQAIRVKGLYVGCDGVDSTKGPALVEIGPCTYGANAPGTNSTSVTPLPLDNARPETIQSTCGKAWSTEPTTITVIESFFVPSFMGSALLFYPLSAPIVIKGGNGVAVRVTQQSGVTVNVSGSLRCEE